MQNLQVVTQCTQPGRISKVRTPNPIEQVETFHWKIASVMTMVAVIEAVGFVVAVAH